MCLWIVLAFLALGVPTSDAASGLVWRSAKAKCRIPTNQKKVFNIRTAQECMETCDDEKAFSCRSVTFHIKGKICYLSRTGIAKVPKETCYTLGFYERVQADKVDSGIRLLPTAQEFLDGTVGSTVTLRLNGQCKVAIHRRACVYTVATNPKGCIALDLVIARLVSDAPLSSLFTLGKGAVGKVGFVKATVDKCQKTLKFETKTEASIQLLPELALNKAQLQIIIFAKTSKVTFDFSGDWKLGYVTLSSAVSKTETGWWIAGSSKKTVALGNIMQALVSKDILPSSHRNSVLRGLGLERMNSVQLGRLHVALTDGVLGFGARVSFQMINSGLGRATMHAYINHFKEDPAATVMVMELGKTTLAKVFQRVAKIDISNVPVIGDLQIDGVTVAYASANLTSPIIAYDVAALEDLEMTEQGVHLFFRKRFALKDPAISFHVVRRKGAYSFEVTGDSEGVVSAILEREIQNQNFQLPPGFNAAKFLAAPFSGFQYDPDKKIITIPASSGENIVLLPKLITLKNATVDFKVSTTVGATSRLGFDVTAIWDLPGKHDILFSINKPAGEKIFIGRAKPEFDIPIGSLLTKFGKALLPGPLGKGFKKLGLSSFEITDPSVALYFGGGYSITTSGIATIGSMDHCDVEVLTGQVNGAAVMAMGVLLKRSPVSDIIKVLTSNGINIDIIPGSSLLNDAEIGLVISSQVIPDESPYLRFNNEMLKEMTIADGMSVAGRISIPKSCRGDQFCKVLQKLLGTGLKIQFSGKLAATSVEMKATIPGDIPLIKGAVLNNLGFEVVAGPTRNEIGVTCSLRIPNPKLTFTGSFGINPIAGVYLGLSMKGWVTQMFKIPFLHVGNLNLRVAIPSNPTLISQLEIGGTALIGLLNRQSTPINAAMYLGVDTTSPMQNYFFGNVSKLTIPSICAAFGYRSSLPKVFRESGFHKGVYISFAFQTKSLPNDITIEQGFYFKGLLNIMGLELQSDMSVDLNGIYVTVTAKPFDIGNGLISITDASGRGGPSLNLAIGWNPPKALIHFRGSVSFLRIRRSVELYIDHRNMRFTSSGKFLGLFQASFLVTSSYEAMKTADVTVKGSFKSDFFSYLREKVLAFLESYRQQASRAIGNAQRKLNHATSRFQSAEASLRVASNRVTSQQHHFDAASNRVRSLMGKIESLKTKFDSASRSLAAAERRVSGARSHFNSVTNNLRRRERACPSSCRRRRDTNSQQLNEIEAFLTSKKAKQFIKTNALPSNNKRWLGRVGRWVEEKKEAALCAARWTARQTCLGALKTLQGIVSASKHSLYVAIAALKVPQAAVSAARGSLSVAEIALAGAAVMARNSGRSLHVLKGAMAVAANGVRTANYSLNAAKGVLEGVKRVHAVGVDVGKAVARYSLGGLFEVRSLSFTALIGAANSGTFPGRASAKILGRTGTLSLTIRLKSLPRMITDLVTLIRRLLQSEFGRRRRRSVSSYPRELIAQGKYGEAKAYITGYLHALATEHVVDPEIK